MSGQHYVELVIESGELQRRFRCDAPEDADCRRRPPGKSDAESWSADEATEPGHVCWAVDWVEAAGIEDAIRCVDDQVLASVPVEISYEEGVEIEPTSPESGDTEYAVARAAFPTSPHYFLPDLEACGRFIEHPPLGVDRTEPYVAVRRRRAPEWELVPEASS